MELGTPMEMEVETAMEMEMGQLWKRRWLERTRQFRAHFPHGGL